MCNQLFFHIFWQILARGTRFICENQVAGLLKAKEGIKAKKLKLYILI